MLNLHILLKLLRAWQVVGNIKSLRGLHTHATLLAVEHVTQHLPIPIKPRSILVDQIVKS